MSSVPFGFGEKLIALLFCAYVIQKYFGSIGFYCTIAAAIVIQCLIYYRDNLVWKNLGIPGPKPLLFFGNFLEMFGKGPHLVDIEYTKKYGKFVGTYAFTQPDLLVSDIDLLKQILVKDFNNFPNRRNFSVISGKSKTLGAKVLTFLKDEEWKNVRNTITPTFTGGKLKHMEQLVDQCVGTFLGILSTKEKLGENIDIKELLSACTMDIIAKCAFATDIDCQHNPDDLFFTYAKRANTITFKDWDTALLILFPWTVYQLNNLFDLVIIRKDIEDFFSKNLIKIIEERKQKPLTAKPDFLQLLINASQDMDKFETVQDDMISHKQIEGGKRIPLTEHEIISQCFLFLIAGYETTAVTMTNTAYLLTQFPETQEKCYQEIMDTIGNERVTYSHIQNKLPYLDAVISEALRLFPPAVRFDRTCKEDYELTENVKIPKGAVVSIPAYVIHHDEEHWPEPEKFNPDRFSPEEKAKRNPLTYLPFGYGPRNCIGMRFAQMEMKMILANAIAKYKFLPCDKTEVTFAQTLIETVTFGIKFYSRIHQNLRQQICLKLKRQFT